MSESSANRPTWATINLDNLAFNFHSIKKFVDQKIGFMAVVKADAYGHDAVRCAKRLEAERADWLGVALPEEGLQLREHGIKTPVLCLSGFWNGQENLLLENRLTPTVYRTDAAESLDRAAAAKGLIADVHVKIDTGMGRIGVRFDETREFAEKFRNFKNLRVEGLMTHFAVADKLSENPFTNEQIAKFESAVEIFRDYGFQPIYKDLANSPAAVAHAHSRGNLMRIGGILYGLGDDVLPEETSKPELRAVMSLHTRIALVKRVPKGETLGYGRTFETARDSMIATVPIGYYDGYPRALSNNGQAIVKGVYCPIVGRVSMDWTLLDVTEVVDIKVNDEVTLIGNDGALKVTAEDLARRTDTISYEITCGINRRVRRKYVGS